MIVLATREGLIGKPTASGFVIDRQMPFVALPNVKALYQFVRIANPRSAKTCIAIVLDVGPWNEHDPYADPANAGKGLRPASESGIHVLPGGALAQGKTNGAGIDLSEKVWSALGMTDNGQVDWIWLT